MVESVVPADVGDKLVELGKAFHRNRNIFLGWVSSRFKLHSVNGLSLPCRSVSLRSPSGTVLPLFVCLLVTDVRSLVRSFATVKPTSVPRVALFYTLAGVVSSVVVAVDCSIKWALASLLGCPVAAALRLSCSEV